MRILVYAPYWKLSEYYGGVLTSITLLFESIAQQGVSVSIYTTNAKYSGGISVPEGKPIILDGVNVYYFPLSLNGLSFFYSHALIKAVKKNIHNYDIVIIESLWSHAFPKISSICKKCNKPYIVALHGQLMPWALRQKWLKKSIYLPLIIKSSLNRASALHCTDPVEVQATKELNLHAPTFVLPNGVDLSEYDLHFE